MAADDKDVTDASSRTPVRRPDRRHELVRSMLITHGSRLTDAQLAERAGCGDRLPRQMEYEQRSSRRLLRVEHPEGRGVELGPGVGLMVGVSLGEESLRVALVDVHGEQHASVATPAMPSQLQLPPDELLLRIRQAVHRCLRLGLAAPDLVVRRKDEPVLKLIGVAIAWPSPMNRHKVPGAIALRHRAWRQPEADGHVPSLFERTAAALGGPFTAARCHALNDVSAHALALAFDAERAQRDEADDVRTRVALTVRVGGGLGAATVLRAPHRHDGWAFSDSSLIEGLNGWAGELGHVQIEPSVIAAINRAKTLDDLARLDPRAMCSCGQRYHLQAFASGSAFVQRLKRSGATWPDGREVTSRVRQAVAEPNQVEEHALRDIGQMIGRVFSSSMMVLDPSTISFTGSLACTTLTGGFTRASPAWESAIGNNFRIEEVTGERGAMLGVRGAALAVLRRTVHDHLYEAVTSNRYTFDFDRHQLEALGIGVPVQA